jgi:hypothetical protein
MERTPASSWLPAFCCRTARGSQGRRFDPPNQRRLQEGTSIECCSLLFGVLVEHLAAPRGRPPRDHATAFSENVVWQHFSLRAAVKRLGERVYERLGKRVRRTESRQGFSPRRNPMPRNEVILTISIRRDFV